MTEADLDSEKHRDICHQVSREAVVLLKNNGSALPLSKDELKDAALIGPMVDAWYPDWYGGTPPFKTHIKGWYCPGVRPNASMDRRTGSGDFYLR